MSVFRFKHFQINQTHAALKVGTDSMVLGSLVKWKNPKNLLDIGTGTGVLALMCAQRYPFKSIIAVEITEKSCVDAQFNFDHSPFESPIQLIHQPIQNLVFNEQFDAIICNPPYFENNLKNNQIDKTIARHTDELSFEELFACFDQNLSTTGSAWIIVPSEIQGKIRELSVKYQLYISSEIRIFGVANKEKRMVFELSKQPNSFVFKCELIIRDTNGNYTEGYKQLTKEFHFNELS